VPEKPFEAGPVALTVDGFTELLHKNAVVFVNFYAPWCFWSNRLTPAWDAVAARLHARSYSQSVKFIKVDCTGAGQELCRAQSVHAFPSIRIYRGSSHAFEPYEFGREENVIWLHLVKTAAEVLVAEMQDVEPDARGALTPQISHVSADLRSVMARRQQGLDEDWSEDALSSDEEVDEDRDLLAQISQAVESITSAKGVDASRFLKAGGSMEEAEAHAMNEHTSDVVLGLLSTGKGWLNSEKGKGGDGEGGEEDDEPWDENYIHEGCQLFGYIDVSRAPGTLHVSPHSARHSFDFSSVNTSHHVDHLSFGLELSARERARLPRSVASQLTTLDGLWFVTSQKHETSEHHVNVMPTSFETPGAPPIETYQFTATSHFRTRDTLPSLLVSYDVSPIHAHIVDKAEAFSDFVVSLCAIVGGAVSVFGILDGMLFTGQRAVKRSLNKGL